MDFWSKFSPDHVEFHPETGVDEEGNSITDERYRWIINAPTFGDEKSLSGWLMNAKNTTVYDIATQELTLTFGGTNFPHPDSPTDDPNDPDFKPALYADATPEQIRNYLDSIPSGVVMAMWTKLREVAPNWGPEFQRSDRQERSADTGPSA